MPWCARATACRLPRCAGRARPRPVRDTLRLRLAYRPPLAWRELLEYLAGRVTPGRRMGFARAADRYARTVRIDERTGWVSVRKSSREPFLTVELPTAFADALFPILGRLRALFDLDANPGVVDDSSGPRPGAGGIGPGASGPARARRVGRV